MEFPPKERREPRRYEPPPWEAAPRPAPEPEPVEQPAPQEGIAPPPQVPEVRPAQTPDAPPWLAQGASASPDKDEAPETADGPAVDAMLFELSAVERTEYGANMRGWGMGATLVIGFIGSVILVFAIVAFVRTAQAGVVAMSGAAILAATGAMLLMAAGWMFMRINNRRGVQ